MKNDLRAMFGRVLREPLIQFLLIGLAILSVVRLTSDDGQRYVIDAGRALQEIERKYQAQFGNLPSPQQRRALLDAYIKEEIFYREGLAMGLGEDDVIVRRRIAQKYAFANEDLAVIEDPGDDRLQQYYSEHADRYREPLRICFKHLYFPNARGISGTDAARDALEKIRGGQAVEGEEFPGPEISVPIAVQEAERLFGLSELTSALISAPEQQWSGPFQSAYGQHLLYVFERLPGRLPRLAEIREEVLADYRQNAGEERNEQAYRRLLGKYRIVGGSILE